MKDDILNGCRNEEQDEVTGEPVGVWADAETSLGEIKARVAEFTTERDWDKFHTPKDLAICTAVESSELLQLFLWVDYEIDGGRPAPERSRIEAEMADVAVSLLNLSNRLGIDLARAIERKLSVNALKYPIDKARGSALKYSEYKSHGK